jgi:ComEC/Rec2-related protein
MIGNRLRRGLAVGPLVPAACAVVAALAAADRFHAAPGLHAALAACLLGGGLLLRWPAWRRAALLLLAMGVLGGLHVARLVSQDRVVALVGREVVVSGRLLSDPRPALGGMECLLAVEQVDGRRVWPECAVRVEALGVPLVVGDKVRLAGVLGRVPAVRNPGEFDLREWLHRQGADCRLQVFGPVEQRGRSVAGRLSGWFAGVRQRMGAAMTVGLDPVSREAQVIRAMTLGEPPQDDAEVVEMFRHSGTLHVFSVSGMHVGMVGGLLWLVLRACRVPRRAAIVMLIAGMFFYAAITGLSAPALRAALMAAIFLSGFLLRRQPQLLNSLAASLLVVLAWDSHQLFTAGFQLSYGVLASIALLGGWATRRLEFLAQPELYLPRVLMSVWQERWLRWRRALVNLTGMSVAAWTGSTPLTAIHFSLVSPLAVIAGLPVTALVWLIIALALGASILGLAWAPAAVPVNRCNAVLAGLAAQTAGWFAELPGGYFRWSDGPRADVLVFDLARGGAATQMNFGGGTLLDAGSARDFRWIVEPALKRLDLSVDSLVVSHPDGSHVGGMVGAVEVFGPRQALLPVAFARSPWFRAFQAVAPGPGIPAAGARFELGDGAQLVVLDVAPAAARHAAADDRVMVVALERGGWRILFTGDAGPLVEQRLLDSGVNLRADVLVMGRHESGICGSDAFLTAVAPRVIVSSHANFPQAERIPDQWAAWVERSGIRLLRQDRTGAVLINWTDRGLELRGFVSGETHVLARPGHSAASR